MRRVNQMDVASVYRKWVAAAVLVAVVVEDTATSPVTYLLELRLLLLSVDEQGLGP